MNKHIEQTLAWEQLVVTTTSDASSIEAEWKALAEHAHGPYTCYAWCQAWYQSASKQKTGQPLIVVARRPSGQVEMILPLFLERQAGLRLLSRPARTISGDFGGIFSPKLRSCLQDADLGRFWRKIFKAVPADLMMINGVTSDEIERGNPLAALHRMRSPIDGFHTTLSDDWQAQYEKMFSSKIRRNDRRCSRRMAEEGEVCVEVVEGAQAQSKALTEMIEQKAEQLAKAGQDHHYANPVVQGFFAGLADLMAQSEDEEFLLVCLKFNGEVIASNFGVRKGNCHFGLMTAMNADMRKYSPGRLVMLETARVLAERGCTFYDFGNGEYQYKSLWCTGKRERYAVYAPVSLLGRLIFPAIRLGLRLRAKAQARAALKAGQKAAAAKE